MKTAKSETKRLGRPPKVVDDSPTKVKTVKRSPARSPGRARKSSPETPKKTTTGRTRSPSRRSPARKSPVRKSPARKSPSRKQNAESTKKSPSGRAPIANVVLSNVFDDLLAKETKIESSQSTTTTRLDDKNGVESNFEARSLRARKPKLSDFLIAEKYTRRKNFEKFSPPQKKLDRLENNLSEDDDDVPSSLPESRNLSTPLFELKNSYEDFGGPFIALFMIIIVTVIMVGANIACSNQPCTFTDMPKLQKYSSLQSWFTFRAFVAVAGLFLFNVIFSLLPYFGKKTVLPDKVHTFNANGLLSMLIVIAAVVATEIFYHPVLKIFREDYIQLQVTSVVFGILLAFGLFFKSNKVPFDKRNPKGSTGNVLYDFCVGREINPVVFQRFHVKVLVIRYALILGILINLSFLHHNTSVKNFPVLSFESLKNITTYYNIAESVTFNPTLYVFSLIQIIYLLDALRFESTQVSTFEFMHEGVGLLTGIGYFIYPFFHSLITKRILDHNITYPAWLLAITTIIFALGYYIYRASNSQKSIFRENPTDRRVAHLQTLPTFQGKKLLIGGWWGFVRHPNYLGDILIHLALGIGAYNAIPIYSIVLTFMFLIERNKRDGKRCSEQYSIAWKRYCQKVPYSLLPRVY